MCIRPVQIIQPIARNAVGKLLYFAKHWDKASLFQTVPCFETNGFCTLIAHVYITEGLQNWQKETKWLLSSVEEKVVLLCGYALMGVMKKNTFKPNHNFCIILECYTYLPWSS